MKPNRKTAWNVVLASLGLELDKFYEIAMRDGSRLRKIGHKGMLKEVDDEIWIYTDIEYEGEDVRLQDLLNRRVVFLEVDHA